jgi:hypothetical protein
MTLQELVQLKRNELELEQQELFNNSTDLFKIQLDLGLGHEVASSMDLLYFAKVNKFTTNDYEDVKASLKYNGEVYIITLTDNFFEIRPLNGSQTFCFKLVEAKDKLVDYLANIAPFHNSIN